MVYQSAFFPPIWFIRLPIVHTPYFQRMYMKNGIQRKKDHGNGQLNSRG